MSKVEFREADELVSALQNDVEGIIFELRGKDKRENDIGVPACFSGTPYDWYRLQFPYVEKIELEDGRVVVYSRGNRYKLNVIEDYIGQRELELRVREEIDRTVGALYRSVMIDEMKRIGMIR